MRLARTTLLVAAAGLIFGGTPLLLGPPNGDDAYYHAMRAQQQARCWRAGVLLPRWYPDLNGGLGGPEPRAYPLGTLAMHGAFALLLDDGVAATAVAAALVPAVAGLVMLVVLRRRRVGELAAALGALAWTSAPYLLIAVHERTALAEGWGLAVLPWVLDAWLPPAPRSVPRAAISLAVMLVLQLPLALMAGLVVGAAWMLEPRRATAAKGLQAALTGLAVGAVSWLPNVWSIRRLEGERLVTGDYAWTAHLLPAPCGPAPALAAHLTGAFVVVVLAAAVAVAAGARRTGGLALGCCLLSTSLAAWAYQAIPGLAALQFPWRWLGPASCLAVLSIAALDGRRARWLGFSVLLLPLALSPGLIGDRLPQGPALRPSAPAGAAAAATRYGVPPLLPSLPAYLPRGMDLAAALEVGATARRELPAPVEVGPERRMWRLSLGEPALVHLPVMAAAGWRTTINGEKVGWQPRRGVMAIEVPAGDHEIALAMRWLPEDVVGAVASVIALALLWLQRRRTEAGGCATRGRDG